VSLASHGIARQDSDGDSKNSPVRLVAGGKEVEDTGQL